MGFIPKSVRTSIFIPFFVIFIGSSLFGQSGGASMTIYKDGRALVKQPVGWEVLTGITRVNYDLLPAGMVEDSPFLIMDGVRVGYQRLNRNVFTWEKFYSGLEGQEVEIRTVDGEEIEGILLDFNANEVILQQRSYLKMIARRQVEWITAVGTVDERQEKPYLSWDLYSRTDKTVRGELFYLSRGYGWDAIYRLLLDPDTTQAELVTEAYITNHGNLNFVDLELQLVEGNLNQAGKKSMPKAALRAFAAEAAAMDAAPGQPQRETLGDYHIYSLPERISLSGSESVTVRLYNPSTVNYLKTYLFTNNERSQREEPLAVEYKFTNSEENQLNKPLPQGKIELYQLTARGGVEYLGEDRISQVPRGETVKLIAGRSFDVFGTRKVLNYDRQRKSEEAAIELTVTNTRDEEITVRLIENITGEWVIRDESSMYIKVDATTIHFPLTVAADSTVHVTYTYRKAWN